MRSPGPNWHRQVASLKDRLPSRFSCRRADILQKSPIKTQFFRVHSNGWVMFRSSGATGTHGLRDGYRSESGSISTRTAVWGISLASQKESAPLSNFVMTERFGDLSRNWKRCSFFKRASGAEAGPRMRMPFPSDGEKYSERRRDQRIAFSRFVSRTITFAREGNGGYVIMTRNCSSRS